MRILGIDPGLITTGYGVVEIRDNGVGIPSPSDERQQSFGLRLVGMLAGQLHGRIETEQESGLAFRLRFQVGV